MALIAGTKILHHDKDEYNQLGLDCIRQVYDLLTSGEWRLDKRSSNGDTVSSLQHQRLGKVYKLRCRVKYPAKALGNSLLYDVQDVPKWNPTVLESFKIKTLSDCSDITYHVSAAHVGGLIKSRDFVNFRYYRLMVDGKLSNESFQLNPKEREIVTLCSANQVFHRKSEMDNSKILHYNTLQNFAISHDNRLEVKNKTDGVVPLPTPMMLYEGKENNLPYIQNNFSVSVGDTFRVGRRVWIGAGCSIELKEFPVNTKYIRGHNFLSAFVMHEIEGNPDECIFEWIICVDLKGSLPGYIVDKGFMATMNDFAKYLRKYINDLHRKNQESLPEEVD